jgi:polyhydroxyalkanoate synthesis repressor PhaR
MADTVQTAPETKTAEPPVVVKKYANRRLYDTRSSSYITLDNLAEMVRQGRDFVVYDAKTGEDITRGVLTQIIVEEEGKGRSLLPTAFLRQLIGFYGDQMQSLVPKYLEQAMAAFAQQQEQMRAAMQKTMGSVGTLFPFGNMEEVSRQNMAMMERAFSLFTPFYRPTGEGPGGRPAGEGPGGRPAGGEPADEIASLHAEVERLRLELAAAKAPKETAPKETASKETASKETASKE